MDANSVKSSLYKGLGEVVLISRGGGWDSYEPQNAFC